MVQAARSGAQNIAEGSQASGTSRKFEIKLTSVARASLEELKLDCYLLDRQIQKLADTFEKEGGFTERLYRVRSNKRKQNY